MPPVRWTQSIEGKTHTVKNHQEAAAFIWNAADEVLRGTYTEVDYGHVILPFVVIRRLDCVLEPTKQAVLDELKKREGKVANLDPFLRRAADESFYNTSPLTLTTVLGDEGNVKDNLNIYLAGFSANAREILERFGLSEHIKKLDENELLYRFIGKFTSIDLHPNVVNNTEMGYIFEELLRRTWSNESAGDHYTPREFIRLMVAILLAEDEEVLTQQHAIRSIYDPACGTGGMLAVAEEYLRELNPNASLEIFGQQLLPETWAICCADMMLKGHDPANIAQGDTLKSDKHKGKRFDYLISNPPFGQDWKKIKDVIQRERDELGYDGRFGAGLPRVTDGALLFLQHMISKMKPVADGGSRLAIVFNGSPLFAGDAGEGESEIRRWIIENDWLEAVVALPDDMFFNTNISTFVWIVTNRKAVDRRGKVQLIDARSFYEPMPKSMGKKRKFISDSDVDRVLEIYGRFEDGLHSRVFVNEAFGYRRVTIDRPWTVSYAASMEAIDRLVKSREMSKIAGLGQALSGMVGCAWNTRSDLAAAMSATGFALDDVTMRRIGLGLAIAAVDGEDALDAGGQIVPAVAERDTDRIPLLQDPQEFLKAEVHPFAPGAWIDAGRTKVGYEIPMNKIFYTFQPPRAVSEIDADLDRLEQEMVEILQSFTQ